MRAADEISLAFLLGPVHHDQSQKWMKAALHHRQSCHKQIDACRFKSASNCDGFRVSSPRQYLRHFTSGPYPHCLLWCPQTDAVTGDRGRQRLLLPVTVTSRRCRALNVSVQQPYRAVISCRTPLRTLGTCWAGGNEEHCQ